MPPKIRELIRQLEQAGFRQRKGKGSHKNFNHHKVLKTVTISGKKGEDAKAYQVRLVKQVIREISE